jgi:hypothetical protein
MAIIDYDNSNLLGAPHKDYVNNQIIKRQEILGKTNKSNKEIVWENGRTAYIALASSVNIENTLLPYSASYDVPSQPTTDPLTTNILNSSQAYNNDGERRIQALELDGDPTNWLGNYVASQYVLFGGTSTANFSTQQDDLGNLTSANAGTYRFGVTQTLNEFNNSAYGLGGTEMGLAAMPGITGFNVKSRNMGSLREVTVNIRANSKGQFKIIDNLYCRIGYSMFLEWGNSVYFDNVGEYVSSTDNKAPSLIPTFLTKKYGNKDAACPSTLLKYIELNRERSNGNYDAFFGRVKNFSWEFNKDGYYEITLSLISWGDVIESLGIDKQYGDQPVSYEEGFNSTQPNNTSALSTFLSVAAEPAGTTKTTTSTATGGSTVVTSTTTKSDLSIYKTTLVGDTEKTTADYIRSTGSITTQSDTIPSLNYTRLETSIGKIVSATAQFGSEKPYFYIRLGDILDFIKDRLLVYHPQCNNEPIVDIDTKDENYCYYSGINISADPSKVMVRASLPYSKNDLTILASQDTKFIDKNGDQIDDVTEPDWTYPVNFGSIFSLTTAKLEFFVTSLPKTEIQVGKIMNIYFEYQYLIDTISKLRDQKTKKLPLFDFITELCNTANSCLGGVNRLSVRLKDDNILQIYDQNDIYGRQYLSGESTIINLYGFNNIDRFKVTETPVAGGLSELDVTVLPSYKAGSFVTDFSIKTELTNEFSTTVSIGAQAQGQVVGEDSTGLSKWNYGLVDRFYPSKIDSLKKDNNQDNPTTAERINRIRKQLKFLWLGYAEGNVVDTSNVDTSLVTIPNLSRRENVYYFEHFQTERYSEFVKLQQDWLQENIKFNTDYEASSYTSDLPLYSNSNQIGMLPINIQVTMDGLSGIRIYDQLGVDVRFIPNYYPQTLTWIIKGVSHEIVNDKWFTKLDTIAVPKLPRSQNLAKFVSEYPELSAGLPGAPPSEQNATGGDGASPYDTSPLAKKLASLGATNGNLDPPYMNNVGSPSIPVRGNSNITFAQNSSNHLNFPQLPAYLQDSYFLAIPASIKLGDLSKKADADGISFTITSTYRSYAAQVDVKRRYGDKAASPGSSPHGWGGAIDIAELYAAVGGSIDPVANAKVRANNALYQWLEREGPKVGWVNPKRMADGAGRDECWHWEWWGTANLDLLK